MRMYLNKKSLYLRYTLVFICSTMVYTLEWQTSIQAKIHNYKTCGYLWLQTLVYPYRHIHMFCTHGIDMHIYRGVFENYSYLFKIWSMLLVAYNKYTQDICKCVHMLIMIKTHDWIHADIFICIKHLI